MAQAAGRVIRSPADRSTVFLIDDRYAHSQVRSVHGLSPRPTAA
ncbi:MAG TPA: helicase C-terminal domain-containing protein [Steroidobacteraceae bacterium]|nr:helicase C-terminal domain-containing protein [Steroidobacteraceae bacterium]